MITDSLNIRFLSDWHCGSGLGESHLADAVLNRDADGIPVVHGRAVKGALREGAWRIASLGGKYAEAVELIWGSPSSGGAAEQAGRIFVGPAELPSDLRLWLRSLSSSERAEQVSLLTVNRARTALENGVAAKGSLRSLECGIPGLIFVGRVTLDFPESERRWIVPYMRAVCAAVKSLGADRARGLGRCEFRFGDDISVALPQLPDLSIWRDAR